MSEAEKKDPQTDLGVIRALPGNDRPEDALAVLHEELSQNPQGVIIAIISANRHVRLSVLGDVWRQELAWVATILAKKASED